MKTQGEGPTECSLIIDVRDRESRSKVQYLKVEIRDNPNR